MTLSASLRLAGLLLSVAVASAQLSELAGPSLGYVFIQATSSVHPILGSSLSGYIGAPVVSEVEEAWIAPTRSRAVLKTDSAFWVVPNLSGSREDWRLLSSVEEVTSVAWSADSLTLAIYEPNRNSVSFVDLTTFEVKPLLTLNSGVKLAGMAMGKQRDVVLATVEGTSSQLLTIGANGNVTPLARLDEPVRFILSAAHKTAYVVGGSSGTLSSVALESGELEQLAQVPFAPENSAGLAAGPTDATIYLISTVDNLVRLYDRASGEFQSLTELDFVPTSALPVASPCLFVLNAPVEPKKPVQILNSCKNGFVSFLPAWSPE